MFFGSIKEINRLISKGMSISYLKVTIEKNWRSQNFDFISLKNLSPGQFLGCSNSRRYQSSGSKTVWGFSVSLSLKGIMTF